MAKLTKADVKHCGKTLDELRNPRATKNAGPCGERWPTVPGDEDPCQWPDCDCFESETIMLSTGYAEVNADGTVVQYGTIVLDMGKE